MKSEKPTQVCKLCFKEIKVNSLYSLTHEDLVICKKCIKDFKPRFIKFAVLGHKALSIYDYDDKIQALLYQFKGCFDYEIKDVFIKQFSKELSIYHKNYVVVPIPSYKGDDEIREFNHVEEIFKSLNLPIKKLLVKTKKVKQADRSFNKRKEIHKYLELVERPDLSNTKILLVDDVYTTGSTMKAAVKLIEQLHPKKIKILVLSKTINHK